MRSAADTLLLATRSPDKAREIRLVLGDMLPLRIVTLEEAGLPVLPDEDDIETFDTFLGNASAKAAYFAGRAGLPVLADDSGLCVDALGGAPGVRSRRFAADGARDAPTPPAGNIAGSTPGNALSGDALDRANNMHLLQRLHGVATPDRAAHYACAAALHLPDGRRLAAIGTCSGSILMQPLGTHGFGYDPLFLDPVTGLSFGELDPAEKNRRSHRARAFRAIAATAADALRNRSLRT
jgi:XTP/dITP diphosphohydrolase